MKNLLLLFLICLSGFLQPEYLPLFAGGEWCTFSLLDPPAIGKPLRFSADCRDVKGKLAIHAHWITVDGVSKGFLTGQNGKPFDISGSGNMKGTITLPAKPDLGKFFFIIFTSPDGSFQKKDREARTQPISFIAPQAVLVTEKKSAAVFKPVTMEPGSDWCTISLQAEAVPGKPLVCNVQYRDVSGLLGLHAHWNDAAGKSRGFLAGATRKPPSLSGSGTEIIEIVIPEKADLAGFFLIAFISPDGNYAQKSKEARTMVLYPAGVKPLEIKSPALPLYDKSKAKTAGKWCWQEPAAHSLTGDLVYQARPFVLHRGKNIRYIDYSSGSDKNDGKTPGTAWQHHPDDPAAVFKNAERGDTYVFKRGVIYRGEIMVSRSGTYGAPVIFTADPAWGKGEAVLAGSERISSVWKPAAAHISFNLTGKEKIWYTEIGTNKTPRSVWEIRSGRVMRVPIARFPNWRYSNPDDFRAEWASWEGVREETEKFNGQDRTITIGEDRRAAGLNHKELIGATVWSEHFHLINAPLPAALLDITARGEIKFIFPSFRKGPVTNCRYYIENRLALLDSAGEHYFDPNTGRLYLRLVDDHDPNTAAVEIACRQSAITIQDQSHILINGLSFRFINSGEDILAQWMNGYNEPGCIRLFDDCSDIEITHCNFSQAYLGIGAVTSRSGSLLDELIIRDNTASDLEIGFADISDGYTSYRTTHLSVVLRARILRNAISSTGMGIRPMNNLGNAIVVSHARLLEIAGNHIENCGGVGINVYAGKAGNIAEDPRDLPLVRTLVHHNRVINPLLIINDYGGIESWMCGPNYMFNNISGNPGGYKHFFHTTQTNAGDRSYNTARFGFAYYLDGPYKNFLFNNIAWGKNNDVHSPLCNTAALMDLIGYGHSFFNNSFYNFACAMRIQEPDSGRDVYLGNIFENMSSLVIDYDGFLRKARDLTTDPIDYQTMAMARNIISGSYTGAGLLDYGGIIYSNFNEFRHELEARRMMDYSLGMLAAESQFINAVTHDFRLQKGAAACNQGVSVFVPWGLARTAGEWNFYRPASGAVLKICGENLYFSDEYQHRLMYKQTPKNDLECMHANRADFVCGPLDNWIPGAFVFNGSNWCVVTDQEIKKDMHYSYTHGGKTHEFGYRGKNRQSLDMNTNNFLIEMIVLVQFSSRGGAIVSKKSGSGYELAALPGGMLSLSLFSKSGVWTISSQQPVFDGKWHHVLAELDRQ
ncbi:MAG TPA: hypothetical protein DC049_19960, partial [Spirochaetia bacterium]|nr:hypothetical protein [Spirochaetia bacterium]